ncbi:UNVERIFIED_CONTAM: hypothetical protein GTU68_053246 [Idotea baltica]|nr:hypothetical protein [Idotea baltica]
MDQIAEIINRYPKYALSIEGHTDNTGNADYNQQLSEKRARRCFDYLVNKGVSASRISSAGYGETRPIADNDTKTGRSLNRRVEFNLSLR